ncbi:MAG TPA: S8 family serine peptidase [Abditibacterium sp.]
MLRKISVWLGASVGAILLSCGTGALAQAQKAPGKAANAAPVIEVVPGEIVVRFRAAQANGRSQEVHGRAGAKVLKTLRSGRQHVKLPPGLSVSEGIKRYKAQPEILDAQPNFIYRAVSIPNDPRWSGLYGMAKISAPLAWDTTTGSGDVVVAVIDTGVLYTHEDLAANMWRNAGEIAGNGIDDDQNGYKDDVFGIDPRYGDSDPADDNNHGTHVAGTIGGAGNNGLGVAGVNWNVKIMALKFLGADGSGTTVGAIQCFEYATLMKSRGVNVRVTNNSWGGAGYDQAAKDAMDAAANAGMLHVCAAGNNSNNNDITNGYPTGFDSPSIVSVAASDSADNPATFTNYGATQVDLAAPGVGIVSALATSTTAYGSFSGTSMATPHVAGAAALLASATPGISVATLRTALLNSVDVLPQWSGKVVTGGRLNVARALQSTGVMPPSQSPPTLSSFSPNFGAPSAKVTLNGLNFSRVSSVQFNGLAAVFSVVSDTQISTSVPKNALTGPIRVATAAGATQSAANFVVAPRITSFSPISGPAGTEVTLTGANFSGATMVKFNAKPAAFTLVSDIQITATVPLTATTGRISVTTPAGTASSVVSFTVTSPVISSFSPTSGPEGLLVTINGAKFDSATTVRFNGVDAAFAIVSAAKITATVPQGATTGPISVVNAAGTATSVGNFLVKPAITSFSPSGGAPGSLVTLRGTSFSNTTAVKFAGKISAFTIISPNEITATVPTGALTGSLAVTSNGQTGNSAVSFVVAPRISSFSPTSGVEGTTVTINGVNFSGATAVAFNGIEAAYSIVSASKITVVVPPGATTGKIGVTNVGGSGLSIGTFTVIGTASASNSSVIY